MDTSSYPRKQITLTKGVDLPISGIPEQRITIAASSSSVALLGRDYLGLKPSMLVTEGEHVKLGQAVLVDKRFPQVRLTAPAAGTVRSIVRGAKRVLRAVIIDLAAQEEAVAFSRYPVAELSSLRREQVIENLLASGLWCGFRTRPYSKVPDPKLQPYALFVTAIDTRPLAASPSLVIAERQQDFANGLVLLAKLTDGLVHVCRAADVVLPQVSLDQLRITTFAGPHPAGLPGTHIHHLAPVSATRSVWHIGYQDVLAIGRLFTEGYLDTERICSLAGPSVLQPRLIRTRLGANIRDLTEGELAPGESRIISGSVLNGHRATQWGAYLGRHHHQISVLPEGREREFFGWIKPWGNKHSVTNAFFSAFNRRRLQAFTTAQHGSPRAMVPTGIYERLMPLDVLSTQLLRALLTQDTELAQKLGCLELDEEDLSLCTYACHSKYDYGAALRANLEQIEKEG